MNNSNVKSALPNTAITSQEVHAGLSVDTKHTATLEAECKALTTQALGPRPNYDWIDVNPPTFVKDGQLHVSAEGPISYVWADYYGELKGNGCAWINPTLEAFATKHGGYWEWEDPGSIVFVQQ